MLEITATLVILIVASAAAAIVLAWYLRRRSRPDGKADNLKTLVREARQGLEPWDELPADRRAAIAEKCGVAEIQAAIVWLDELSRKRDALPDWDGDSNDDIAKAQEMLQSILARVQDRYVEFVTNGLNSPHWWTRVHVAAALAGHDRAVALPILRDALARETDETARQLIAMTLANAENAKR
jgi:hypothetical protein